MVILYPECYTEKFLCEYIGYSKNNIVKCNGKPDVIGKIKSSGNHDISIGIVDEDPMTAKHPDYKSYEQAETFLGMRLLKNRNSPNHFLIEFSDEFEPWIININRNKKAKIDFERFNIKKERLHEYTGINLPDNYKKFLKALFKKFPDPIDKINEWIAACGAANS